MQLKQTNKPQNLGFYLSARKSKIKDCIFSFLKKKKKKKKKKKSKQL